MPLVVFAAATPLPPPLTKPTAPACQRMAPKFKKAAHEFTVDSATDTGGTRDGTTFTFAEVSWVKGSGREWDNPKTQSPTPVPPPPSPPPLPPRYHPNKVEWSVNKEMCRSLGLKIMPSVMMFYKGTKIEQFVCRPDQVRMT